MLNPICVTARIVENVEIHDTGSSLAAESDATLVGKLRPDMTNQKLTLDGDEDEDGNCSELLLDLEGNSESTEARIETWRRTGSVSEQTRPMLPYRSHTAAV